MIGKEQKLKLNRERNVRYRAKLTPAQKQAKYLKDRVRLLEQRKQRISQNDVLLTEDKRICSRCFKKKSLSEFSTKGICKSKYTDMCDICRIKIYKSEAYTPIFMTETWWRKKAYCANSCFMQRVKRIKIGNITNTFKKVSGPDVLQLYTKQSAKCVYCDKDLSDGMFQIDHITPLSKQGTHSIENLQLLCIECNRLKHTTTDTEFRSLLKDYYRRLSQVIEHEDKEPHG